VASLYRARPARRVAYANRSRHRLWLRDGRAEYKWRGACGLEPQQARYLRALARRMVLFEPDPVGGDIARVADRQRVKIGRIAQVVDDLEGGRLLPIQPEGIHRVY